MKRLIFSKGFSRKKTWFPVYDLLPFARLWYTNHQFLETGVETPAIGFYLCWLDYQLWFEIQQGY
jgi:hypothetical protein